MGTVPDMTSNAPYPVVEVSAVDEGLPQTSSFTPTFQRPPPPPPPPRQTSLPQPSSSQYATRDQKHGPAATEPHQIPPGSSVGQFSFAPATQTTVVTTSTTTTTNFPPLVIKPPRAAEDLDPKLYPLASAPTPASLKNLRFDLGGKSVVFNEPEDTTAALKEVRSYTHGYVLARKHSSFSWS